MKLESGQLRDPLLVSVGKAGEVPEVGVVIMDVENVVGDADSLVAGNDIVLSTG